jgi:hypothetical protein
MNAWKAVSKAAAVGKVVPELTPLMYLNVMRASSQLPSAWLSQFSNQARVPSVLMSPVPTPCWAISQEM